MPRWNSANAIMETPRKDTYLSKDQNQGISRRDQVTIIPNITLLDNGESHPNTWTSVDCLFPHGFDYKKDT